jgi:regulatory protein
MPRRPRPRSRRSRSRRRRLPDEAYELALKALGYRERTESELRGWLAERGVEEAEIEEVIALLAEAGAIDDASFARRYAEDKRLLAGWGPDRITRALEGRGVAPEYIEAALGAEDDSAELERATSVLLDRGLSCGSERERERALGLLVRRGYPLELAYEAVRAAEREARDAA